MKLLLAVWNWIDDRTGLGKLIAPVAEHPVPADTGWWYVFGSATLFAFIVQVVTGIALATAYVTSTGDAYQSLQFITHDAFLGNLLRGIHFWGASAMVLLIGIHALRVFVMGSYKFPREVSWLTGVFLLLVTIAMGFTGQLLRWDQNAIWSIVVGAEQAGRTPLVGDLLAQFILAGRTVGGATLSRFFSFHVFFIPAVIFGLLGLHLWLVLHNGISEPPVLGDPVDPKTYRQKYERLLHTRGVPFWPDAAWRDVIFGAGVVVVIVALAVIFGPPELGKPPDPSIIQAYPRPDWYMLWYFAALALVPPGVESLFIIGFPMLVGLVLIALPFIGGRGERHPLRRPWAVASVIGVVLMVVTLWIAGAAAPWSPAFDAPPLPAQVVGTSSGAVAEGAQLFHDKGCEACHMIDGYGGQRGPNLSTVADRLTPDQLTLRIINGGINMPAFAGNVTTDELDKLVAFLNSRRSH